MQTGIMYAWKEKPHVDAAPHYQSGERQGIFLYATPSLEQEDCLYRFCSEFEKITGIALEPGRMYKLTITAEPVGDPDTPGGADASPD